MARLSSLLLQATGLADAGLLTQHPPPCGGHEGSADHLRHCGPVDHALCRESMRNCEQVTITRAHLDAALGEHGGGKFCGFDIRTLLASKTRRVDCKWLIRNRTLCT